MYDLIFSLPRALSGRSPAARAQLHGCAEYPGLSGEVLFFPFRGGSIVSAAVSGLPYDGFLGFHLHEGGSCTTDGAVAFYGAGGHYNPEGSAHPQHAGDFPVLLSCGGFAFSVFYTDRILPWDAFGRTVILHSKPDDFRTQPAGDSGSRIACGIVRAV